MRLMRADLHVHTSHSPDSLLTPAGLAALCERRNLGCVAVTDHNTIEGALRLAGMDPPFRLIVGEEITTREGEIVGLFLSEEIPAGLGVLTTIELIRAQGGLVVLPHPCDRLRRHVIKPDVLAEVLPLVDAVEVFNGRTLYSRDNLAAAELAKKYAKPGSAGSDSHTAGELGVCGVEIGEFTTPASFLAELEASGKVFGRPSGLWVHVVTKAVKIAKRQGH